MYRYTSFIINPFIYIYNTFFLVTLDPKIFAKRILRTDPETSLKLSFKYLIGVVGIAYLLFSLIINMLTGLPVGEFYYTIQSLLIYTTAYFILIILTAIFTKATTKRTVSILNFSVGSGHLLQSIFIFVAFLPIRLLSVTGYIPDITLDLTNWDNFEKTYVYFLNECAQSRYFLFRFLFAANPILVVPWPFILILLVNPVIILVYAVISAKILRYVFDKSITKFVIIAIFTYIFTYGIWNIGHVYAFNYVDRPLVCGDIALRNARQYTSESMLKKLYGQEYSTKEEDPIFEVTNIVVTKMHITKHIRMTKEILSLPGMVGAIDGIKNSTQKDICQDELYSTFRELGVSLTEIYYTKEGAKIDDFTVTANACPSLGQE